MHTTTIGTPAALCVRHPGPSGSNVPLKDEVPGSAASLEVEGSE